MKLSLRDKFPEMTVTTTKGEIHLPEDYHGKWFILFSHPADFTPVCTTEFVGFQKKKKQFEELGVELIGLSVDNLESHQKWIQWIKENIYVQIDFPVIDDEKRIVSETLGLIQPNADDTTTVRAVIIVDHNGKVRTILEYPKEIGRSIDEILRTVKALKLASTKRFFLRQTGRITRSSEIKFYFTEAKMMIRRWIKKEAFAACPTGSFIKI